MAIQVQRDTSTPKWTTEFVFLDAVKPESLKISILNDGEDHNPAGEIGVVEVCQCVRSDDRNESNQPLCMPGSCFQCV